MASKKKTTREPEKRKPIALLADSVDALAERFASDRWAELSAADLARVKELAEILDVALMTGQMGEVLFRMLDAVDPRGRQLMQRRAGFVALVRTGLRVTKGDRIALATFLADTMGNIDPHLGKLTKREVYAAIKPARRDARELAIAERICLACKAALGGPTSRLELRDAVRKTKSQ